MMNSISKYAIGILLGVALIICYIFFYHKPEIKRTYDKAYSEGYDKALTTIGTTPPDTIKWIEYREQPAKPVKPKLDSLTKTFSIDTTVWDDYGNVRVYSNDIANGLNIKPVYYEFYQLVLDTIVKTKMDTVYVPDKPVIEFGSFTTGAIVGGSVAAVITYFITKAVFKKE